MSWPERIQLVRDLLGVKTQTELAELLGVSSNTLHSWTIGKSKPSSDNASAMRCLCVEAYPGNIQQTLAGDVSISIDGSADLYEMAIRTKSPVALHMAVFSILVKQAHAVQLTLKIPIVSTIESVYGSYPAKGRLVLRMANMPEFMATVTVLHTKVEPLEFHCVLEMFWSGAKERTFAFVCSDGSVDETCLRIACYLKMKAKHYNTREL